MKRRDFIKKTALTTAGALITPYILPSGRLFAQTSFNQKAKHVVLVMFAGGVRHQEASMQGYLHLGQGIKYPDLYGASTVHAGNIMPNLFNGTAPDKDQTNIIYGSGPNGEDPLPTALSSSIQSQGVTFKEIRSYSGGHYGGWTNLLQGNNAASQGLKQKPIYPTIFEYIRRELGTPASKVWFIGNGIGSSIPLLNYSEHPDYGAKYGANFFAPSVTFGTPGQNWFRDAYNYHPDDELAPMYKMKYFLDNNFANVGKPLPDIKNTEAERYDIHQFMKQMFTKTSQGTVGGPNLPASTNGDASTIRYAAEVFKYFKPTFLAVNIGAVDSCHQNYTGYLRALHQADHSVGWLWNYIKTQCPDIADDTMMIVTPECGRDLNPNPIKDDNELYAYDHSDDNSRRAFCSIIGGGFNGAEAGRVFGDPTANVSVGLTTNVVPTVAEALGIKQQVYDAKFLANGTKSFYEYL